MPRQSSVILDRRDLVSVLRGRPGAGKVDAVLSSDDNHLTAGGGVSLALREAGGPPLATAVLQRTAVFREGRSDLALGDVIVTTAGRLPARFALHLVTTDLERGEHLTGENLGPSLTKVFALAAPLGIRSVALPFPGTGFAGIPRIDAAKAIAKAWRHPQSEQSLTRLIVSSGPECPFNQLTHLRAIVEGAQFNLADLLNRDRVAWTRLFRWAAHSLGISIAEFDNVSAGRGSTVGLVNGIVQEVITSATNVDLGEVVFTTLSHIAPHDLESPAFEHPDSSFHDHRADAAIDTAVELALEQCQWTRGDRWIESVNTDAESLDVGTKQVAVGDTIEILGEEAPRIVSHVIGEKRRRVITANSTPLPVGRVLWRIPRKKKGTTATLWALEDVQPASVLACESPITYDQPFHHVAPSKTSVKSPPERDPVLRLAEFIHNLPSDRSSHLLAEGRRNECIGTDRAVLEEQCFRLDPIEVLRECCGRSDLIALLDQHGLPQAGSLDDLLQRAAEVLGFTTPKSASGSRQILMSLENALLAARAAMDLDRVSHTVFDASVQLERAIKMVLRFQSEHLFQQVVDRLIADRRWLDPVHAVENAPLGALVAALHGMANALGPNSDDPAAARFAARYPDRSLLPAQFDLAELPRLRNLFHHDSVRQRTLADGRTFVRLALDLVKYWCTGEPRLFPPVVRVVAIHTDQWNRTHIEVETDDERRVQVYTGRRPKAGRHYFLLAHSNPVHMFPVMVPVGENPATGERTAR